MDGGWQDVATLCVAVFLGALTTVTTVYALWRTVQDRRVARRQRILDAATVAVRWTEATMVRPLLTQRLVGAVNATRRDHHSGTRPPDPLIFRLHLYGALLETVALTADEKQAAFRGAERHLRDLIRTMAHPPIRLASARAAVILRDAIEVACNLRPPLAVELIHGLGAFCRGVEGGGQAAAPGGGDPRGVRVTHHPPPIPEIH